jgi:hypothetical protein
MNKQFIKPKQLEKLVVNLDIVPAKEAGFFEHVLSRCNHFDYWNIFIAFEEK